MAKTDSDLIDRALEIYRAALSTADIQEQLDLSPEDARRLWTQAKRRLVAERLTEKAAREFAAETSEVLSAVERYAIQQILGYNGGSDKLSGFASLLKLVKESRLAQLQILQELGLLPNKKKGPDLPPAPLGDPSPDDLRASIDALEAELERREKLAATPSSPALPPGLERA